MSLRGWGWDEQWAEQAGALDADLSRVARVTGQERDRWSIQTEDGPGSARIPGASGLHPLPVTGDWVEVEPGPAPIDPWSLLTVLPRRSLMSAPYLPGTALPRCNRR